MPREQQPERAEPQSEEPSAEPAPPDAAGTVEPPAPEPKEPGDPDSAPGTAGETDAQAPAPGQPPEPRVDPRELPLEEVVRRLREQMADPDWHDHERALTLRLTVPEDPAGEAHLRLAFGPVSHPERTRRTWRHAQTLVDASPEGRILGASLELIPGGGRWHAWLHVPLLDGGIPAVPGGTLTPLGILRRVERAYRDAVVADGARALVARGRRIAAAEAAAQAPAEATGADPEEATK